MTKKIFTYEFEQNRPNQITYEYSLEEDEKLDTEIDGEEAVLYLNKSGARMLAKILIKMAEGDYEKGFHVHLNKDFGELSQRLRVVLSS